MKKALFIFFLLGLGLLTLNANGQNTSKRVVIFNFKNISQNANYSNFSQVLADGLAYELGKNQALAIVDRSYIGSTIPETLQDGQNASQSFGGDIFVMGGFTISGDTINVTAAAYNTRTGAEIYRTQKSGSLSTGSPQLEQELCTGIAYHLATPIFNASTTAQQPYYPGGQQQYQPGQQQYQQGQEQYQPGAEEQMRMSRMDQFKMIYGQDLMFEPYINVAKAPVLSYSQILTGYHLEHELESGSNYHSIKIAGMFPVGLTFQIHPAYLPWPAGGDLEYRAFDFLIGYGYAISPNIGIGIGFNMEIYRYDFIGFEGKDGDQLSLIMGPTIGFFGTFIDMITVSVSPEIKAYQIAFTSADAPGDSGFSRFILPIHIIVSILDKNLFLHVYEELTLYDVNKEFISTDAINDFAFGASYWIFDMFTFGARFHFEHYIANNQYEYSGDDFTLFKFRFLMGAVVGDIWNVMTEIGYQKHTDMEVEWDGNLFFSIHNNFMF